MIRFVSTILMVATLLTLQSYATDIDRNIMELGRNRASYPRIIEELSPKNAPRFPQAPSTYEDLDCLFQIAMDQELRSSARLVLLHHLDESYMARLTQLQHARDVIVRALNLFAMDPAPDVIQVANYCQHANALKELCKDLPPLFQLIKPQLSSPLSQKLKNLDDLLLFNTVNRGALNIAGVELLSCIMVAHTDLCVDQLILMRPLFVLMQQAPQWDPSHQCEWRSRQLALGHRYLWLANPQEQVSIFETIDSLIPDIEKALASAADQDWVRNDVERVCFSIFLSPWRFISQHSRKDFDTIAALSTSIEQKAIVALRFSQCKLEVARLQKFKPNNKDQFYLYAETCLKTAIQAFNTAVEENHLINEVAYVLILELMISLQDDVNLLADLGALKRDVRKKVKGLFKYCLQNLLKRNLPHPKDNRATWYSIIKLLYAGLETNPLRSQYHLKTADYYQMYDFDWICASILCRGTVSAEVGRIPAFAYEPSSLADIRAEHKLRITGPVDNRGEDDFEGFPRQKAKGILCKIVGLKPYEQVAKLSRAWIYYVQRLLNKKVEDLQFLCLKPAWEKAIKDFHDEWCLHENEFQKLLNHGVLSEVRTELVRFYLERRKQLALIVAAIDTLIKGPSPIAQHTPFESFNLSHPVAILINGTACIKVFLKNQAQVTNDWLGSADEYAQVLEVLYNQTGEVQLVRDEAKEVLALRLNSVRPFEYPCRFGSFETYLEQVQAFLKTQPRAYPKVFGPCEDSEKAVKEITKAKGWGSLGYCYANNAEELIWGRYKAGLLPIQWMSSLEEARNTLLKTWEKHLRDIHPSIQSLEEGSLLCIKRAWKRINRWLVVARMETNNHNRLLSYKTEDELFTRRIRYVQKIIDTVRGVDWQNLGVDAFNELFDKIKPDFGYDELLVYNRIEVTLLFNASFCEAYLTKPIDEILMGCPRVARSHLNPDRMTYEKRERLVAELTQRIRKRIEQFKPEILTLWNMALNEKDPNQCIVTCRRLLELYHEYREPFLTSFIRHDDKTFCLNIKGLTVSIPSAEVGHGISENDIHAHIKLSAHTISTQDYTDRYERIRASANNVRTCEVISKDKKNMYADLLASAQRLQEEMNKDELINDSSLKLKGGAGDLQTKITVLVDKLTRAAK
jgi:hypothetical protein